MQCTCTNDEERSLCANEKCEHRPKIIRSELSGKPHNWIKDFYGGQDPDLPYLTPEHKKEIATFFEEFKPKLPIHGRIQIFGTSSNMDSNDDLQNLFFTPINYKLKDGSE